MTKRQELLILYAKVLKDLLPTTDLNYYGRIDTVYLQSTDKLKKIDDINVNDKIVLAQILGDESAVAFFKKKLVPTEEQLEKYKSLYKINHEIDKTLNPEFLDSRYDFLSKRKDILSTDIGIQQQIIGLSDERLKLFEMLYNKLEKETKYSIPYLPNILDMLSDYRYDMKTRRFDEPSEKYGGVIEDICGKIKKGETIIDEDLTNLLFLSQAIGIHFNVDDIHELRELSSIRDEDKDDLLHTLDEEEGKEEPDIERIKGMIMINVFGLHPKIAEDILKSFDLEGIERTKDNNGIFEIYDAIKNIMEEDNPQVLINVIRNTLPDLEVSNNYAMSYKLEHELKLMFAKEYNKVLYSPSGKPDKIIGSVPVYYAGDNFKMMVTSVGAYQVNLNIDNYKSYWNSPRIMSHMNCCSLIANNNLSMADVRRTILGFSNFDEHMLLLSGVKDLNSTPISKDMYGSRIGKCVKYMHPDKMIDYTRTDYNEIVYERRDLGENAPEFKKQPDYILFVEEFIDPEKYMEYYEELYSSGQDYETFPITKLKLEDQENLRVEAFKAAQNMGLPVVVVNREKCIQNQRNEISHMLEEFEQTQNPALISRIITEFENARASLGKEHFLLQRLYFPARDMTEIISRISNIIESNKRGSDERKILKRTLYESLKCEKEKNRNSSTDNKSRGQTTAIDYSFAKESLERL